MENISNKAALISECSDDTSAKDIRIKPEESIDIKTEFLSCDICNKSFETIESYDTHMQIHTEECNTCHERLSFFSMLLDTDKGSFTCTTCLNLNTEQEECFEISDDEIEFIEQQFKCEICSKCFSKERDLNLHSRTHTEECSVCRKRYNFLLMLYDTDRKSFICTTCKDVEED